MTMEVFFKSPDIFDFLLNYQFECRCVLRGTASLNTKGAVLYGRMSFCKSGRDPEASWSVKGGGVQNHQEAER